MGNSCTDTLERVRDLFDGRFALDDSGDSCLITTPYLRHDNDFIVLRLEDDRAGHIVITDAGETVDYLRMSGLAVRGSSSFRQYVQTLETSFGVEVRDEEVMIETTPEGVAAAFEAVARASLDLSYLVFRRRERATLSFEDRVEAELIRAGAHYQNDVEIQGRTKLNHFKFFVNGDRNAIVQPLSATSRSAADAKAERFLFHVFDVRERSPQYRVYSIVDDRAEAAPLWVGDTLQSLSEYTDGVIRWSDDPARAFAELFAPIVP